ncbi:BatD family protein [Pseudomonas sp. R5(2019)]|uniref:BatD family protein n=1 Tax=Pseudomonas sp. R5(2019) TaxID=2697566 RepID=UPI001411CFB0|nr:BatD family protein [Pseudomonas sp. R5(2019)]NBA94306.1 protein BatD [Pseudomonas sp. R5(2019)]
MSRFSVFFLSLMMCLQVQAAELNASVDRTRLNSGETVELVLETHDVTEFGKPDLTPLDTAFEVQGSRQVNRLTTLDGQTEATTRWIITLLPRQSGTVEIPALRLGELASQPITLQVMQSEQVPTSNLAPVFIDASLDTENVYVQAQVVLTVRIYHSVSLYDDSSLTPLQIADARIDQLGESRTFEKLINGVRHGVIEMRYAIYPQHSGALIIPAQVFTATPVETGPGQDLTTPKPGKQVQVTSAEMALTVKAKPVVYPADAPWLPAHSLTLSENWSPEPGQNQVGDSVTRTLILKAEGLSSAQLPPLPATEINGLRRYPDQPRLSDQNGERGLIGSREEREALVPTRSGSIEVPSVEVVWWNTHEDHLEHSSLPARTLHIEDNPGLTQAAGGTESARGVSQTELRIWQLISLLLACTTASGFSLWWRGRRLPAIQRAAQTGPSPRTLLDDLKRACQANDPHTTRQALDAWARQQPETLADMAARFVPLSDALDGLNGALYSEAGQYWQGEELWRAIGMIPVAESNTPTLGDSNSLPPLYPK